MPLVTSKEILLDAKKNNYAVGAFNANNMEIVQAIIEAAEEERSPVIVQASQGAISYAGLEMIVGMVKVLRRILYPVVLHLDQALIIIKILNVCGQALHHLCLMVQDYLLKRMFH